jgi:hypothetical protein
MRKKIILLFVTLFLVANVSACGSKDKPSESSASESKTSEMSSSEATTTESTPVVSTTTEPTSKATTSKETTSQASTTPDQNSSESSAPKGSEASGKVELGDQYVNMEQRSFAINGKVYTLGQTTLQEMIDDGVPFDEDDIANADNNLGKNSTSPPFKIQLAEYYTAQVSVGNFTDENVVTKTAPISWVYLPIHLDKDEGQMQFAFPLDMTRDQLIEKAGEPSSEKNNTVEYKAEAEKYIGDSGYRFDFNAQDGSLQYVTIDYKP